MDNYWFYLSARVQCFKSSEQDFSSCSFFRCVIWFRCGPWRLHHLIRCHPCSSFVQQFEVRCWQYPAQCVCARRSRSFTWWNLGVVKLHQVLLQVYLLIETRQRSSAWVLLVEQNQKCICSSLTLSIVSKTKLMDDKFMSVVLITFVRSDRSTLWKDNLSMYMSLSLYLSKIECVTF